MCRCHETDEETETRTVEEKNTRLSSLRSYVCF